MSSSPSARPRPRPSPVRAVHPTQIAERCFSVEDKARGVRLDVHINAARTWLQFCSGLMILPPDDLETALGFLEWNACLDWPAGSPRIAYAAARREIFLQGTVALAPLRDDAAMDQFLGKAVDFVASIKAQIARHH